MAIVPRVLSFSLVVALSACGASRDARRSGEPPPHSGPPAASAPSVAAEQSPVDPGGCGAVSDCELCAAASACRWCTEPRGCVAVVAACTGLMLSIPRTCENDPVVKAEAERQRREADAAQRTRELTPEGAPIVGRLESFPGVDLPISRGRCYLAIVRLGKGAMLGRVREHVQMQTTNESATAGSTMAKLPGGPPGLSCPRSPGKLSVTYSDWNTWAKVTKAGQGEVSVQFFSAPISDADLAEGDRRAAELTRKIERMPAGCDDCDFDCRSIGGDCERRCFVDFRERGGRTNCENGCKQITRACQRQCESMCR